MHPAAIDSRQRLSITGAVIGMDACSRPSPAPPVQVYLQRRMNRTAEPHLLMPKQSLSRDVRSRGQCCGRFEQQAARRQVKLHPSLNLSSSLSRKLSRKAVHL